MVKKIELRIANNVDTTKVFSANLRGGSRGIDDDTMALETHSNDVVPTLRTLTNWILICEPMNKETNKEQKICAMRGRSDGDWHENVHEQRMELRNDEITNTLTGVAKDNYVVETKYDNQQEQIKMSTPKIIDDTYANRQPRLYEENAPTIRSEREGLKVVEQTIIANTEGFGRQYESKNGSPTIKSRSPQYNNAVKQQMIFNNGNIGFRIRRLTERELFRLMDVSDNDIDKIQSAGISKTQQAKMAGNSIVVNCMFHIFRKLLIDTQKQEQQLHLF